MADAPLTLWQLPPQTPSQMMSYVLRTHRGKVIVIDGGTAGDAAFLRAFLGDVGNHVCAWFVTHQHGDHVEALGRLLAERRGPKIDAVYGSPLGEDWVRRYDETRLPEVAALNEALGQACREIEELRQDQTLDFDGVRVKVLQVRNPDIITGLNDQSVVLQVSDTAKSVLFLGDLMVDGGNRLLGTPRRRQLRSDIVQMANHGQQGVSREFYRAVQPRRCLWATPRWLWANDAGGGPGTGPWRTLETRAWMYKLGVGHHHVAGDGLCRID